MRMVSFLPTSVTPQILSLHLNAASRIRISHREARGQSRPTVDIKAIPGNQPTPNLQAGPSSFHMHERAAHSLPNNPFSASGAGELSGAPGHDRRQKIVEEVVVLPASVDLAPGILISPGIRFALAKEIGLGGGKPYTVLELNTPLQ